MKKHEFFSHRVKYCDCIVANLKGMIKNPFVGYWQMTYFRMSTLADLHFSHLGLINVNFQATPSNPKKSWGGIFLTMFFVKRSQLWNEFIPLFTLGFRPCLQSCQPPLICGVFSVKNIYHNTSTMANISYNCTCFAF